MRVSFLTHRISPLWLLLSMASVGLFSACSHYQLGRSSTPCFCSLGIAPICNNSFAPQIQSLLADQLVRAFVTDGTLQIMPVGDADATLEVTIIDYVQSIEATRDDDTALARSYDLTIRVVCTLIDNCTRKKLFDCVPVSAKLDLQVNSNFVDVQYQAMPALARILAQRIRDRVLNPW